MKILSSARIREADAFTIEHEPIESIDLMERASVAFVRWFAARFDAGSRVKIFSGPGNNGGDGLAIARLLLEKGYDAQPFVVRTKPGGSRDFTINLERLQASVQAPEINDPSQIPQITKDDVVIDALFGSGLDRPVEGLFADVIRAVAKARPLVVAVDIASGLFSDKNTEGSAVMPADFTVSFQVPKLAFFMRENFEYVGQWVVVDIGLDKNFIENVETDFFTIEKNDVRRMFPRRNKFAHKGKFGRALIISGSSGKMGAAVLCSRACLKSGVGLLTMHVPACGYQIMQVSTPEAMAVVDPSVDSFSEVPDLAPFDTIGIGPGLGTNEKTITAYLELLEKVNFPIVIDADGLNMLAKESRALNLVPEGSILTPHPKEFERLAGSWRDDFEMIELQRKFASDRRVVVVLKGAHTSVASPEGKVWFNTTGNPGMASAGSGDVLTGIITALLGQVKDPLKAAIAGVYLHGLAGDVAAEKVGEESLIASDIIDNISRAFRLIRN